MTDLPTAYPLRDLFDAAVRHRGVRLACSACGHFAVFEAAALWWLFRRRGWRDRLDDVRHHFFCAACRRDRDAEARRPKVELVEGETRMETLPLPPDVEWKRELRRRR